jgi:hypothetical protein
MITVFKIFIKMLVITPVSSDVSSESTHGVCCRFFIKTQCIVQNLFTSHCTVDFVGTETGKLSSKFAVTLI